MPGLLDIKRRIKSVQGTKKITKAMQMISAAKMRKAQQAVSNSRTYASLAWELIHNVTATGTLEHELFKTHPEAKKVGVIFISTNTGLVGSLNSNLMPKLKSLQTEGIAEVISYGKRARQIAVRLKNSILADFEKKDRSLSAADILPLAQYITEIYKTGQYKKIVIVYNTFVSTLIQKATVKQLLPFVAESNQLQQINSQKKSEDLLFEPTPQLVLEHLLPRIIESQVYQAILESNASEHSARMVMMKNATEAAGDLIADYTLTYNQLRQNKITTELAEITAGRIALE